MNVEVLAHAASGGPTHVDAHVDTPRLVRRPNRTHGGGDRGPQFSGFGWVERIEVGDLAIRQHHQVPRRVRKGVQQHEHIGTTNDDVCFLVGKPRFQNLGEHAAVGAGGSFAGRSDVFGTPSVPDPVELSHGSTLRSGFEAQRE